jgi:hypothetical protein
VKASLRFFTRVPTLEGEHTNKVARQTQLRWSSPFFDF